MGLYYVEIRSDLIIHAIIPICITLSGLVKQSPISKKMLSGKLVPSIIILAFTLFNFSSSINKHEKFSNKTEVSGICRYNFNIFIFKWNRPEQVLRKSKINLSFSLRHIRSGQSSSYIQVWSLYSSGDDLQHPGLRTISG